MAQRVHVYKEFKKFYVSTLVAKLKAMDIQLVVYDEAQNFVDSHMQGFEYPFKSRKNPVAKYRVSPQIHSDDYLFTQTKVVLKKSQVCLEDPIWNGLKFIEDAWELVADETEKEDDDDKNMT